MNTELITTLYGVFGIWPIVAIAFGEAWYLFNRLRAPNFHMAEKRLKHLSEWLKDSVRLKDMHPLLLEKSFHFHHPSLRQVSAAGVRILLNHPRPSETILRLKLSLGMWECREDGFFPLLQSTKHRVSIRIKSGALAWCGAALILLLSMVLMVTFKNPSGFLIVGATELILLMLICLDKRLAYAAIQQIEKDVCLRSPLNSSGPAFERASSLSLLAGSQLGENSQKSECEEFAA